MGFREKDKADVVTVMNWVHERMTSALEAGQGDNLLVMQPGEERHVTAVTPPVEDVANSNLYLFRDKARTAYLVLASGQQFRVTVEEL